MLKILLFLLIIFTPAQLLADPPVGVLFADGLHDDSLVLEEWLNGAEVHWADGGAVGEVIFAKDLLIRHRMFLFSDGPSRQLRGDNLIIKIPGIIETGWSSFILTDPGERAREFPAIAGPRLRIDNCMFYFYGQ